MKGIGKGWNGMLWQQGGLLQPSMQRMQAMVQQCIHSDAELGVPEFKDLSNLPALQGEV